MTRSNTGGAHTSITPVLVCADVVALGAGAASVHQHLTLLAVVGTVIGALVVSRALHLQQSRLVLSVLEDLPALALVAAAATVLLVTLNGHVVGPDVLGTAATAAAGTLAGLVLTRALAYAVVRHLRRTGVLAHRAVVVGAGTVGRQLVTALREDPSLGLEPVGFVDDDADPRTLPAPLLGPAGRLPAILRDLAVDDVIFAFGAVTDDRTIALVRWCQRHRRQVFVVPRYFEVMGLDRARRTEVVRDITLVRLHRFRAGPVQLFAKRAVDIVVASVALVLLAPLLALAAGLLALETRSHVLLRQERVGRHGRTFGLLKLRTIPAAPSEAAVRWNADDDPRLGRVGRFLRRTGIDELPQLWNILRGEMSLVGPRPERPHFVQQFSTSTRGYRHRHRVATGLTGWAQVNQLRGDTSILDRARADNYYIENWSLWTDAKIVVRTLGTLRRGTPRPRRELVSLMCADAMRPAGSATAD